MCLPLQYAIEDLYVIANDGMAAHGQACSCHIAPLALCGWKSCPRDKTPKSKSLEPRSWRVTQIPLSPKLTTIAVSWRLFELYCEEILMRRLVGNFHNSSI